MANQKAAIARPPTVTMRMMWSKAELCQTAASVPSGMPTRVANSSAKKVSSMVAGRRRAISLDDRAAGVGGVAEVGLRHLPQVDEELLPDRLVEAVGLADGGDLRRRRVLAGERGRGVVGQHPQHDEGQNEQAEQRRHDQQQAAQDEAGHAVSLARRSPPPRGGGRNATDLARHRDPASGTGQRAKCDGVPGGGDSRWRNRPHPLRPAA